MATIAREWGRIGCIGFGGPPTHIALLRTLCVDRRRWLTATEFEDGIAVTNLLPGPASTQLAIFCAWKLRGPLGGVVGGVCFIVPGLIVILALAALFLAGHPPRWIAGAAAGAGAAVPAVAAHAAADLIPASRRRSGTSRTGRLRWTVYVATGAVAAVVTGPWLVVVLIGCGLIEAALRTRPWARSPDRPPRRVVFTPLPAPSVATSVSAFVAAPMAATGGLLAVAWVAAKVGALSYGGGFVIIPLMRHDAVHAYRWMTDAQFLDAVALGQITPGPVVQTVAVVGYAAAGIAGGLLAALAAFAPSFAFVLLAGPHFDRLRDDQRIQAFLIGAGPAAIGAIAGAAVPLAASLTQWWQFAVLATAATWLLALRRGVVSALLGAGAIGVLAALTG